MSHHANLSRSTRATIWLSLLSLFVVVLGVNVQPALAASTITINTGTKVTVNGTFKGFGVQEDTNFLWTDPNRAAGVNPQDDFNNYVKPRLKNMKLSFVRKFIDVTWFAPAPGTYTWNSAPMQGLYTVLQEHQNNGTEVMLTIWRTPSWLSNGTARNLSEGGTGGAFPGTDQVDEFATVITDFMKHLYGTDGSGYNFSVVKYLGAPNELEGTTVTGLTPVYVELDRQLTSAGIRSRVTLFGPDSGHSAYDVLDDAIEDTTLSGLLGFYDFHIYDTASTGEGWPYFPSTVTNTSKQLWLTEIGNYEVGHNTWTVLPLWAIKPLRNGFAAAALWNLQDQIYDTNEVLDSGKWGLWRYKSESYAPKTAFYVWSAVTAHTARNSDVYSISCSECSSLKIAALKAPSGEHTVIVYNTDTSNAQTVNVNYSGATPTQTLYRYLVNPASLPDPDTLGNGTVVSDKTISMTNGSFSDTLPQGAFAVYSSLNPVTSATPAPTAAFPNTNRAKGVAVTASSSVENSDWRKSKVNDGYQNSVSGYVTSKGWTSDNSLTTDHTEWVQLDLGASYTLGKVDLYPRNDSGNIGAGFPIDFTIQAAADSNCASWNTVVNKTDYAQPTDGVVRSFTFPSQSVRCVKVVGTKLRANPNDGNRYRMQFAEIEVY